MKFVSIDIETTGLDPETCDVLEVGAIINTDDKTPLSELPAYRFLIKMPTYYGEPYALSMHPKLFKEIAKSKSNVDWGLSQPDYTKLCGGPMDFVRTFNEWLVVNGIDPYQYVAAGKNFANFDAHFLKKLYDGGRYRIGWHHRIFDPASMFVIETDELLPGTRTCMERAGIKELDYEGEPHSALYDAAAVVALIRKGLKMNGGKNG